MMLLSMARGAIRGSTVSERGGEDGGGLRLLCLPSFCSRSRLSLSLVLSTSPPHPPRRSHVVRHAEVKQALAAVEAAGLVARDRRGPPRQVVLHVADARGDVGPELLRPAAGRVLVRAGASGDASAGGAMTVGVEVAAARRCRGGYRRTAAANDSAAAAAAANRLDADAAAQAQVTASCRRRAGHRRPMRVVRRRRAAAARVWRDWMHAFFVSRALQAAAG